LTTATSKRSYKKLLVALTSVKQGLIERIQREIAHQAAGQPGLIQFKMNAVDDVDVIRALYRAAQAGVKIDLIVRDTCELRPGLPGVSESVRVISIVGRFLEHSRIYHFRNGGAPEYYIGSADCMKRNLESRVEVLTPVEDPRLQKELRAILDRHLADQRNAWEMSSAGTCHAAASPARRTARRRSDRARRAAPARGVAPEEAPAEGHRALGSVTPRRSGFLPR
jgi:polyphosphate kinase